MGYTYFICFRTNRSVWRSTNISFLLELILIFGGVMGYKYFICFRTNHSVWRSY